MPPPEIGELVTTMTALRAVLYARYSTDLQNERSVEDQFTLCRDFAIRQGITVVDTYQDRERSSATLFDREGLIRLMKDAPSGRFDCVIVEHLDRLSRDQEDLPALFKRLSFTGIQILSVSEGTANEMLIGIRALTGALFLKDLAAKVKRGMMGRAREGSVLGRVTYGYDRVPGQPGARVINQAQAKIVERIFMEYISGASPRSIAMRLNAEGVPAPGKKPWSGQLVSGGNSPFGGKGVLTNRIYIGEVAFGRSTTVLNPNTGRKVRRKGQPVIVQRPDLRIISDEMWAAAARIRKERVKVPGRPRKLWARNDGLMAGMFRCHACGGHMIVAQRSRSGAGRVKCSAAHFHQNCHHSRSYDVPRLEEAVLDDLITLLKDRRLTQFYMNEYQAERRADRRKARAEKDEIRRRLTEIEAAQIRLSSALEKGSMPEHILVPKIQALEVERVSLEERRLNAEEDDNVVDVHPAAAERYRRTLEKLRDDLRKGNDVRPEERLIFRNLVESVTVFETAPRALYSYKINGRLGMLGRAYPPVPGPRSTRQILVEQGVSRSIASCYSTASGKDG